MGGYDADFRARHGDFLRLEGVRRARRAVWVVVIWEQRYAKLLCGFGGGVEFGHEAVEARSVSYHPLFSIFSEECLLLGRVIWRKVGEAVSREGHTSNQ